MIHTIICLSIFLAGLYCLFLFAKRVIKTFDSTNDYDTSPVANVPKVPQEKLAPSKNDQRNFHKAALKARRQGHLRFDWHGNWYLTGLKSLDGTGK